MDNTHSIPFKWCEFHCQDPRLRSPGLPKRRVGLGSNNQLQCKCVCRQRHSRVHFHADHGDHTHYNDHEYHDYSYLDELKKTTDPNNEMSHMEFVESLRAKDPSYNETVAKKMRKAPWKEFRVKF